MTPGLTREENLVRAARRALAKLQSEYDAYMIDAIDQLTEFIKHHPDECWSEGEDLAAALEPYADIDAVDSAS